MRVRLAIKKENMKKLSTIEKRVPTVSTFRASTPVAAKRITGPKLQKIRRRILLRDGYACRVCGRVSVDLEVDHIVPLHLGGAESDANRQALCCECHRLKNIEEERMRK